MKHHFKKRKRNAVTIFFVLIIIILLSALTCASYIIVKLNRNNLFSKSIMLNNNYFLSEPGNYDSQIENNDDPVQRALEKLEKTLNETLSSFDEIPPSLNDNHEKNEILKYASEIFYAYGVNPDSNIRVQNMINEIFGINIELNIIEKKSYPFRIFLKKTFYPTAAKLYQLPCF